ncbi:M48 family metalloprotease [Streptomyces sp. NPDC048639]|uniref:M48 family metalloprotease n=1 Tax=Streptomyces sp. NPDC048639 TaxID=3365581 RepID=UPI00371CBB1F
MSAALRALLALALVAGFYVLAWTIVLVYLALALLTLYLVFSSGEPLSSPTPLYLVAFGAPAVVAVVRGLFTGGATPDAEPGSVRVSRRQAPELWRTVTELAERVGAPAPTDIRLTLDVNAAVSEETRFGFGVAQRRMYIGVPLLAGLRADQMRAVLCHELGHYARRHTRFGATVYRGSAALDTTLRGIAKAAAGNRMVAAYSGLQFRVLSAYAWLYDAASFAVRRRQEFEADAAAAAVVGKEATAEALSLVHTLGAAWEDFRARFLDPMRDIGRVPDDPLRAFGLMVTDPDYEAALARSHRALPERARSRFDSHPPLRRRLAALDRCAGGPAVRDRSPALTLLGGASGTVPEGVWSALVRGEGGVRLEHRPWQDWIDEAAELQVIRAIEELGEPAGLIGGSGRTSGRTWGRTSDATADGASRGASGGMAGGAAGAPGGAGTPTLGDLLDLLESGRGSELADALRDTRWGARQWGGLGKEQLFTAVWAQVGQGLVTADRASWSVEWTGPGRLVTLDSDAAELYARVRSAVERPSEIPALRFHLVLCGINTGVPLDGVGQASALRVPPRPVGSPPDAAARKGTVNVAALTAVIVIGLIFFAGFMKEDQPSPGPSAVRPVDGPALGLPTPAFPTPADSAPGGAIPQPALPTPSGLAASPAPRLSPPVGGSVAPGLPSGHPHSTCGPTDLSYGGRCLPVLGLRPKHVVTVHPGDTLSSVACRYGSSVAELVRMNRLKTTELRVGQQLTVPGLAGITRTGCG